MEWEVDTPHPFSNIVFFKNWVGYFFLMAISIWTMVVTCPRIENLHWKGKPYWFSGYRDSLGQADRHRLLLYYKLWYIIFTVDTYSTIDTVLKVFNSFIHNNNIKFHYSFHFYLQIVALLLMNIIAFVSLLKFAKMLKHCKRKKRNNKDLIKQFS